MTHSEVLLSLTMAHERLERLEADAAAPVPNLGAALATHPAWQVNARTNKQWRLRYDLVLELRDWVLGNMNVDATKYRGVNKKATPEGRRRKAEQYVTEHLALGRMLHASEPVDPLFTEEDFEDESLAHQLAPGRYPEFREQVRGAIKRVLELDTARAPEVEWAWVAAELKEKRYNLRRLQELQDFLMQVAGSDARPALGKGPAGVTEKIVGLILRYMCLALDSNFHGSVPGSWAQDLPGFVECFASPFNYKFRRYYSIFEQDREFGSCGNFFLMLDRANGALPAGRYEMNPPWMNAMYERLESVIELALERLPADKDTTLVVIAPDWSDPKWMPSWIPGLNRVLKEAPEAFRRHSVHLNRQLTYEHDVTDVKFKFNTLAWVFAKKPVPEPVMRLFNSKS